MRSIQIHLPSLAIGLAACAVVLVSMSQSVPGSNSPRIEYGPHPRDFIQIKEGTPYTVPANHVFVLTGLGTTFLTENFSTRSELLVNGQREASGGVLVGSGGIGSGSSVSPVPAGLTVQAGAVIAVHELIAAGQTGRAWGYLAK